MCLKPFHDVRNQIGFCGIWCGSCAVGNGALRELTHRFETLIAQYGVDQWAPKSFDFSEFKNGLAAIKKMPICPGCLNGGGRDDCEIRSCAQQQGLQSCRSCSRTENCDNGELLMRMRQGAADAGLFVQDSEEFHRDQLETWVGRLKISWPGSIVFPQEA